MGCHFILHLNYIQGQFPTFLILNSLRAHRGREEGCSGQWPDSRQRLLLTKVNLWVV